MAPKRHSLGDNVEQNESKDINQSMYLPYYDNWIWSKRHRSQEVMLSDSTFRKGMQISGGGGFKPNGKIIDKMYDYSNWNGSAINVVSFDLILFVFHFIDVVQAHYG